MLSYFQANSRALEPSVSEIDSYTGCLLLRHLTLGPRDLGNLRADIIALCGRRREVKLYVLSPDLLSAEVCDVPVAMDLMFLTMF